MTGVLPFVEVIGDCGGGAPAMAVLQAFTAAAVPVVVEHCTAAALTGVALQAAWTLVEATSVPAEAETA